MEELIGFFKSQRNDAIFNLDLLTSLLNRGQYREDVE